MGQINEHSDFDSDSGGVAAIEVILYPFMPAVSVSVPRPFFSRHDRRTVTKYCTHILIYGTHSHLNNLAPRMARKAGLIRNNLRNWTVAA